MVYVVTAITKLKNLKAIHNAKLFASPALAVVTAITKLKNLKAIHNYKVHSCHKSLVVTAITKLKNLKAIHNSFLLANDISSKLLYIPNSYRS